MSDSVDVSVTSRIRLAHDLQDYDPRLIPKCWYCLGRLDLVDDEPVCVNVDCAVFQQAGIGWDTEPDGCEVQVFAGSGNPDSANFGPPEFCEEYALPGTAICPGHAAAGEYR